ncbi:TetR/AcrR family transcriptional regulator [Sphingomonas oleivorans]|nr:TetR/AcrR family transcriptional regulator [Sphingomonas oleivorans]
MSTRDSLIAAAAGLLDSSGPDGVTLRAVGKCAGVSHNAPYKHFQDKEALLAAVAAQELRVRGAAMQAAVEEAATPLDALRAMVRDHVDWAMRHPRRFHLIFGLWTRYDEELDRAAGETRRLFVQAVRAARESGALRAHDDERTAALLMSLAHGAIDLALGGHLAEDGKGRADPQGLVDDLIAVLSVNP